MSLQGRIAWHIGLPMFDLVKGLRVKRTFLAYHRASRLSRAEILQMQRDKLARLLVHAYENVPFYRMRFQEAGLTPADVLGPEDLTKLPPLRREDLQRSWEDMVARGTDLGKCYKGCSSGSTGQPVRYCRDRSGSSHSQAAIYFSWSQAGWDFGKRMLTIWGNPTTVNRDWARLSSKLKAALFGEVKAPAYALSDEKAFHRLLETYLAGGFCYIQGYSNSIHAFAEYALRSGATLPRVDGVLTTAENLQAHQRATIEQALGKVYDFYGCGEINGVAFQCGYGQYHILEPHVVVEYGEVMDGFGGRELLLTDLDNYAMPLLRYANGDLGRPGQGACACDLPFATMDGISGRSADVIRTSCGGILAIPSFFGSRLLKEVRGLVRYQVEVLGPDDLLVNLEVSGDWDDPSEDLVRDALASYIPPSVSWRLQLVDRIAPDPNGKFKLVVRKQAAQSRPQGGQGAD